PRLRSRRRPLIARRPSALLSSRAVSETTALVAGAPERHGTPATPSERSERTRAFHEARFLTRARALFYARLAFLLIGRLLVLFVGLFPTPVAVVPPLLTFPVVAKLAQILGGPALVQIDLFILLWYSAINCIVVYMMVYLNERDRLKHRELQKLSGALREMAV